MSIHPTAIIESGAQVDESAEVGAYAFVGSEVTVGANTVVHHHATVEGYTLLGEENEIFPYACIGTKTQDLKFDGGKPGLKVGNQNTFREFTSIHGGTKDGTFTEIGNHNVFLAYAHVAHDCIIGDYLIMSGQNALAGHCIVGNHVIISWGAAGHQFCRFGDYSFVGGMSKTVKDVPPYMLIDGRDPEVKFFNKVGLERHGFTKEDLSIVKFLYKTFYREGLNRKQAMETALASDHASHPRAKVFLDFMESSDRGVY